ncbi:MAG: hypothetical protein RL650_2114 [Pseudomonadota bacterium]
MESSSAGAALKQVLKIAVIGGGWAGLTAAITAVESGHQVTLFEASRHWGGRARSFSLPALAQPALDNGQHILIGAYQQSLALMRKVGIDLDKALWRLPLNLQDAKGEGLALPPLPFPFNLLGGIAFAKGWRIYDKWSLLTTAFKWQRMQFQCDAALTVQDLCQGLSPRVWRDLIEPLCVSALNTPANQASGSVFLRVLQDAVFGPKGSADLLLPRQELGEIFPHAAVRWLEAHGASCKLGARIDQLTLNTTNSRMWEVGENAFDRVVLATPAWDAATLLAPFNPSWAKTASALVHEPIATVYVQAHAAFQLPQPMLALQSSNQAPAQFVFDRGQMMTTHNTPGLLAFVVSAAEDSKQDLELKVVQQARDLIYQLRPKEVAMGELTLLQTVIEKRATFACTPNLNRPCANPFRGLSVCGDYVAGPYPATLEGAVLSGCEAGQLVSATHD